MSDRPRLRLARAIVGRYPAAWRERYEAEVLALIDDAPPRWRDVVDLSRGCIVERARALFEPADHPHLTIVLAFAGRYLLAPSAVFAIAVALGRGLEAMLGTLPDQASDAVGWTTIATMLVWLTAFLARGFRAWRAGTRHWSVGLSGSILWLSLAVVHCATQVWAGEATVSRLFQWFYFIAYATSLVIGHVPAGRQLSRTVDQLLGAREMMGSKGWARLELNRCETLAAQGAPVAEELARARAELERWQAIHDEALGRLRAMGYRARFL